MVPLYSLRNLTRQFGEREVLHIKSLDIEAGHIYALLGPNGAGKSTLMRILSFLDSPTSGDLFYRGKQVTTGQEERFRSGVVWVPQFPVMFTGSLLYNIAYPMELKKIPKQKREKKALEILEAVSLAHLAASPAHKLSGGEAQRASIARALAAGAEVILFDEPTANVDEQSQAEFISLARDLHQNKKLSLIVTTHNTNLAAALCNRQIFLAKGKLVRQHILPDGKIAWPGTIFIKGSHIAIALQPQAVLSAGIEGAKAVRLCGIMELAAGIVLSLELAQGNTIDVLISGTKCLPVARTLTLGCELGLLTE